MKALFIGGTGTISMGITKALANTDWELYLLNRGNRTLEIESSNIHMVNGDVNDEALINELLLGLEFDVVADFIAFEPKHIERDYRLFKDKTKQFIAISSASAYQKPLSHPVISESTPLSNPYWEYSRNKIACEQLLMDLYRDKGFPITIVRPSHTYDERSVPVGVHGDKGSFQVIKRMLEGKQVIIHGDGSSLWTLTHNSDFAKAFIGLMGNIHSIGEAIHITSDELLTWNQIYTIIADTLGVDFKPYYVPSDFLDAVGPYDFKGGLIGDKANTVIFDNQKLKRLVPEFQATVRFDQGAKLLINNILATPSLQLEDKEFDIYCDRIIEALEQAKESLTK